MFKIVLLYGALAATIPLAKATLLYVTPFLCIGVRMILGGLLLLGMHRLNGGRVTVARKHWSLFGLIALFHIFLSFTAEFWALQYVSSVKDALFFNLSPFITALLALLFLGEKITFLQVCGMTVATAGIIPMVLADSGSEQVLGWNGFVSLPEIALFIAVVSACYGWILVSKAHNTHGYPVFLINGICMFMGGVGSFVLSLIVDGVPIIRCPDMGSIALFDRWCIGSFGCLWGSLLVFLCYIVLQILFANIIYFNLYAALLRTYSVTLLSLCGFMTPILAGLIGWLLFGEQIPSGFMLATISITVGLYLFDYPSRRKTKNNS